MEITKVKVWVAAADHVGAVPTNPEDGVLVVVSGDGWYDFSELDRHKTADDFIESLFVDYDSDHYIIENNDLVPAKDVLERREFAGRFGKDDVHWVVIDALANYKYDVKKRKWHVNK